ncbi:protein-histidine N-methyltransferase [Malassezia cuniculi]|uniref:protein-histidine N-methyltransferase n=1 Tax=Malassezia cuniculi TaxID=948313 RepID=A0AAF0ETS7_9BASI|nr:protein-histidine N-methyltransferase [Malassezia cuniculi]
MSFAFSFDVEGDSEDVPVVPAAEQAAEHRTPIPFAELNRDSLRTHLPERLSYSPLVVPLESGTIALPRRDLFDVRFQVINEDNAEDATIANSESDLVPGVYEGGLKTWECASDLVAQLARTNLPESKRIIEVGCGTAIPSVYMLHRLLTSNESGTIYLCDYNAEVLSLVVYPNMVLAWHFASNPLTEPGELDIDDELVDAFESDLAKRGITLRFFAGGWDTYTLDEKFDIVLSSETVYAEATLPSLVALLRRATTPASLCLVASKVIYFGVGGGVAAFTHAIEASGGAVAAVSSSTAGVARMVMQVSWPSD